MNADYIVAYDFPKKATMVYAGDEPVAEVPDVEENASVFRAIASTYAGPSGRTPGTFKLGGPNLESLIKRLKVDFPAGESLS